MKADGDTVLGVLSSVARRVSQPASTVRVSYTQGPRVVEVVVDDVMENCLTYVAGYLAHKVHQSHRCGVCQSALSSGNAVVASQRDILTGLKSYTGVSDAEVGSLLLTTEDFYAVVQRCYVTTQVQAQTMIHETGVARRLVLCVCSSREATRLQSQMCCGVCITVYSACARC